ncbi:hypothetical protein MJO28_014917 [Puccinia striiformis f. sp. tritici]|uniref:Uncharacterized protein n=2 Tax=Puccinia striiformis f. sp. tritici TaxID=168172 RepID=A0A0L0VE91_9BASI|nr:hypothetical protein Pst134EB_028343 [Puccinia striiformis f. sp. tritici]KAI7937369.1 hypothetical protein MJO29_014684 [Puccinia striiformis f. sp. tritici]KAI7937997.1 hypothetical protein MJO28_014917 [Puccinia striiformis f. sp. tritici]KAI9615782.1 hypothetical protein KEM48_005453 [Puccinia striiformis f. sp. tritici PST-130]KNE97595.1 hypothetical protein PSTG_09144 [Puccinia striiformis f. sp. tritici PST-78]
MSSAGPSYLGFIENQIDEFRPMNTPGPLSIALFFIGFIIINYTIRRLFPTISEGPHSSNLSAQELKVGEDEGKMEEEEDDETGSKDLMRMMLLNRQYLANQSPRINHDNRPPFDSIASSLLAAPLSNPNIHRLHPSDSLSRDAQHLLETSDSCSSSTTSA